MEPEIKYSSRICPLPPEFKPGLSFHFKPNPIVVAVSLILILLSSSLVYYWMLPKPLLIIDNEPPPPPDIHYSVIAIDGDANFSATALLKGWPGDGSPENPYLIDRLDIDFVGEWGNCISISSTRVSFTISNCKFTGAGGAAMMSAFYRGAGIWLANVTNGELVNNTCSGNAKGILLLGSDSNTVTGNNCSYNCGMHVSGGITLQASESNIVSNNICHNNTEVGIEFSDSYYNTVENNTCNNNTEVGIQFSDSYCNTVENNTCNSNRVGICLIDSPYNAVSNTTCLGNIEYDMLELTSDEFDPLDIMAIDPLGLMAIGLVTGITMLGAGWRMVKLSRIVSRTEEGGENR